MYCICPFPQNIKLLSQCLRLDKWTCLYADWSKIKKKLKKQPYAYRITHLKIKKSEKMLQRLLIMLWTATLISPAELGVEECPQKELWVLLFFTFSQLENENSWSLVLAECSTVLAYIYSNHSYPACIEKYLMHASSMFWNIHKRLVSLLKWRACEKDGMRNVFTFWRRFCFPVKTSAWFKGRFNASWHISEVISR